jgi:hypothetical protein
VIELITDLDKWQVTLRTGAVIEVWADGYQEIGAHYVFGVLATTTDPPHDGMLITGRTPSDPSRVVIALSRIPIDAVADLHTVRRIPGG